MRLRDRLELILHPVRLRLLLELVKGERTVDDLHAVIPQVSRATLYRHLYRLVQGGVVRVTSQRAVRGTVEKTYALVTEHLSLDETAFNRLSREEHLEFFITFLSSLLNDYARYLTTRSTPNLRADGVGYHKYVLFLSEDEFSAFVRALNQALIPFLEKTPTPERTPRLFATILMPAEFNLSGPDTAAEGEESRHENRHRESDQGFQHPS